MQLFESQIQYNNVGNYYSIEYIYNLIENWGFSYDTRLNIKNISHSSLISYIWSKKFVLHSKFKID